MKQAGIVAYLRVSTSGQGRSGLGIKAQREAIARFAAGEGLAILGELVEIETGKGADALGRRPKLRDALQLAKRLKAAICVAKLDRLSRDVAFIVAELRANADPVMLHIYAALGESGR